MFGAKYKHPKFRFIHKLYTRMFGYPPAVGPRIRASYVMKRLSLKKNEKILDAGCGGGVYTVEVGIKGAFVIGVDARREAIDLSFKASRLSKISDKAEFIVADLCELPFKDGFFDKVVCPDVLEHIERDLKATSEINRVLKSGGILITHVPQVYRTEDVKISGPVRKYGHVRNGYTKDLLLGLLESSNFRIVDQEDTFKTFAGGIAKIHEQLGFHWSVFPLLYSMSKLGVLLDSRARNQKGYGLLVISKKAG